MMVKVGCSFTSLTFKDTCYCDWMFLIIRKYTFNLDFVHSCSIEYAVFQCHNNMMYLFIYTPFIRLKVLYVIPKIW
jgi:hypothetical protein